MPGAVPLAAGLPGVADPVRRGAGSTLSFFALKKLPDGPRPTAISLDTVMRDTPRHVFSKGIFRTYLWLAVWYCVFSTPVAAFVAYYLKVGPQLTQAQIMGFEVCRYMGVFLTAWVLRGRIDVGGAKPFQLLSLTLYLVIAAYWWLYLKSEMGGMAGVFAAYFLLGVGATCWTVANLNYLPKIIPDEERPLMVSIHGAVTSCLGGCAPIAWGWFLKPKDGAAAAMDAGMFQWFFVSVFVSAAILIIFISRLPEDKNKPFDPLVIGSAILRPFRAVTYLVNLIEPADKKEQAGHDSPDDRKP
jgi:hypothetical protein